MKKIRFSLLSFNKNLIYGARKQLIIFLIKHNYEIINSVWLPTIIKKFCVIRSPHIDKDSREQFEIRHYKLLLDINLKSLDTLNLLYNIELPLGVSYSIKLI